MSEQMTSLIKLLLAFSVIVLIVLVVVLVIVIMKKKKDEQEAERKYNENNTQVTNVAVSSTTKTFTLKNVKNFMDFEDIRDNMVIQNKGKKFVMVVKCQGVNYDLMSSIEKISVEQGFVQFLNALTRPIQLYIQARKINLEESVNNYKVRLREIESRYNKIKMQYDNALKSQDIISKEHMDNLKMEYTKAKNIYEYTKDIIANTEKMSLNKNILTKNYYLAISYVPEADEVYEKEELIDMAFSELYTNAQSLLRVLTVCGVTGKILDSEGLADLLYVAYNRDSSETLGVDKAIKAGYDSLYVTAPDVIEKKMKELDKVIEQRALDLANETIDQVNFKSRKRKELEEKEKNIQDIVKSMAKMMIEENEDLIGKEVSEESIKEIDKQMEKTENKKKKGA